MNITTIAEVVDWVKAAGAIAFETQRDTSGIKRDYKSDGSVLTTIDKKVEDFLVEKISDRFPAANIITEETVRSFDPERSHTFVIDPIDGTDVYSQGLPGWCVSVGLLDHKLNPIAGVVFSPCFKMLFFADIGKKVMCNGEIINLPGTAEPISRKSNLMISSRIHHELDLSSFPGKIRGIGSGALHLCLPLVCSAVIGSIGQRGAYIWDIAGAHAINLSVGYDLEFLNGRKVDYARLIDGTPVEDVLLSGSRKTVIELRKIVT